MKHYFPLRFGAELADGGVAFRLWAPRPQRVELCLEEGGERRLLAMDRAENGWFTLSTELAGPGTRYRYRIDGTLDVPDPASRFQPSDIAGPSEVVDPGAYDWRVAWAGRPWDEMVIYELHAGTFSPEGSAIMGRLEPDINVCARRARRGACRAPRLHDNALPSEKA